MRTVTQTQTPVQAQNRRKRDRRGPAWLKIIAIVASIMLAFSLVIFALVLWNNFRPAQPPGSSSIPGLTPSTSNIHLALIFNHQITDVSTEQGFDFLWGGDPHKQFSGNYNTYYYPFDRSGFDYAYKYPIHDLAWFQHYHPTWIVYECDGVTPAFDSNDPQHKFVPIDITNPEVINYQMSQFIVPHLSDKANGYSGVAFDNMNLDNAMVNTGKGEIRCGTRNSQGIFHNRWGGSLGLTIYREDVINWVTTMRGLIRRQFPSAIVAVNFSYEFDDPTDSNVLLNAVDIDLDERGFSNWGNLPPYLTDQNWVTYINAINSFQADGGRNDKGFITINLEPGKHITHSEVQWALASYMMTQARYSYFFLINLTMQPSYYGFVPQWLRALVQNNPTGSPTAPATPDSNNVYSRTFTHALALVNPSSSQSYPVTLTRAYHDIYGQRYSGTIILPAHSGLVLLPV